MPTSPGKPMQAGGLVYQTEGFTVGCDRHKSAIDSAPSYPLIHKQPGAPVGAPGCCMYMDV